LFLFVFLGGGVVGAWGIVCVGGGGRGRWGLGDLEGVCIISVCCRDTRVRDKGFKI